MPSLGLRGISSPLQFQPKPDELESSCSASPCGSIRECSGFLSPSFVGNRHSSCLKWVGCLRIPKDRDVSSPFGFQQISFDICRSGSLHAWLRRASSSCSPCRRAFARRPQEAPLGRAIQIQVETLTLSRWSTSPSFPFPSLLGQVTTSGPESLRRGLWWAFDVV